MKNNTDNQGAKEMKDTTTTTTEASTMTKDIETYYCWNLDYGNPDAPNEDFGNISFSHEEIIGNEIRTTKKRDVLKMIAKDFANRYDIKPEHIAYRKAGINVWLFKKK